MNSKMCTFWNYLKLTFLDILFRGSADKQNPWKLHKSTTVMSSSLTQCFILLSVCLNYNLTRGCIWKSSIDNTVSLHIKCALYLLIVIINVLTFSTQCQSLLYAQSAVLCNGTSCQPNRVTPPFQIFAYAYIANSCEHNCS